MTLESSLERRACRLLERSGYLVLKVGREGWPDRLVISGPNQHFWVEFKAPGKPHRLTKAQKIRIPMLRERGEKVLVVRDMNDLLGAP